MWTILNFEVRLRTKKGGRDICKGTIDIEFERNWSFSLDDGQKIKNYLLVSGIFPGKADSVILLGFECTINPQNLFQIVRAIF